MSDPECEGESPAPNGSSESGSSGGSRRAWLAISVALAVTGGVVAWVLLLDRNTGPGGRPPGGASKVRSHVVESREFIAEVEALGTVRASETADISANVTETVERLLFDGGQEVEQGQLLAELSSAEEQAALLAAQAGLREQEREVDRLEDLVSDGAVPEIRLEERRTMLEVARQQVAEAEAKVRDRSIVAPFSGVLGLRRISTGALVTPGTVITTLDHIDRVYIDFTVAEAYLADLRPGLALEARASAYPDEIFKAEVKAVDSRVDPVTRAVEVRAEIANEDHRLRPGMLMTTRLQRDPRESPAVPERAVVQSGERAFVFVIEETEEDPGGLVARRREVAIGRRVPGWAEILSGVELGSKIVGTGVIGLTDGSGVEVTGEFDGPSPAFDPRAR